MVTAVKANAIAITTKDIVSLSGHPTKTVKILKIKATNAHIAHQARRKTALLSAIKAINKRLGLCPNLFVFGSLSTVVGDEKLSARENDFRSLSLYVQSDENLGSKVLEVTKSKRLSFDVFNKLVSGFQFGIGIRLLQSVGNISFVL